MAVQVVMHLTLPVTVHKEGKWFVSSCPILNVSSQGRTQGKSLENLGEALYLFLRSCYERGSLDQVLRESGLRPVRRRTTGAKRQRMLTVPLPFMIERQPASQ